MSASCIWWSFHSALLALHFVLMVQSQAPGDQDNFCTTLSASITPPSYPPNSIILMDSYNYVRLLPPAAGTPQGSGVWQQVDVDGTIDVENNNAPTSWLQPTSSACREAVSACYFNLAPPSQSNWLITQHISREVNGNLLPQVSVQVEFQLTGCEAGCQRSFLLEVWETSNIDATAAMNTTQYRRVQRVAPNSDSGLQTQNASIPVNFNTNETGFYVAFVDDNTCIAITRVIVFYYVCPKMIQDFIVYPETLSPPIDSLQPQSRQVLGQCVEGAEGELSGMNPSLQCIQAGKWGTLQVGTGCQCKDGFFAIDDDQECTNCPAGEYVSPVNNSCQACPANTRVDVFGVAACPCINGYYRAPGENGDFACTQPPGMPTNIVVRREGATAFVSWTAPDNLGGRTDIFYRIWYEPQGGERMASEPIYNATMGTITGLQPNRKYRIYVSAENGVSEVASSTTEVVLGLDEFTTNSTPLIVGIVIAALAVIIVLSLIIIFVVVLLLHQRQRSGSSKDVLMEAHPVVPIAIKGNRTYVDPLTYASVDDAIEEFATEIEPKHLKLTMELGAGEFGTVYRAVWKDQSAKKQVEVAVKTLKPGSSTKARSDFLNEASIMGQFCHDHVIKLYGVITKVDPAMIIMEFMENGSLYSYLRKNDEKLNTTRLLKMARGVCSGMEYLSAVGYVHRDLAARNVLLDKDEICKVADFGLSREVVDDEYNVQKGGKIPVRWTAPEAIFRRKFTSSSDVWSFGILLWEVMTYAQHPYDDWDNQEVLDNLEAGYRLSCPYGCPSSVHEVMLDCWNKELSQRPTFGEVLKRLDLLLHTESPPKRPPKKNRNSGNPSTTNPLHCKSVDEWLTSVKMERYSSTFQDNGIKSVNQLVHLKESDLREMGITLAGHLHKLTSSIENGYVEMKRNSTVHN